jgi:hypothetical protein
VPEDKSWKPCGRDELRRLAAITFWGKVQFCLLLKIEVSRRVKQIARSVYE